MAGHQGPPQKGNRREKVGNWKSGGGRGTNEYGSGEHIEFHTIPSHETGSYPGRKEVHVLTDLIS